MAHGRRHGLFPLSAGPVADADPAACASSPHAWPTAGNRVPAKVGGVPGTGWDLHEYRHSGLTHLGEAGASLPMLVAKSRHKKPENV